MKAKPCSPASFAVDNTLHEWMRSIRRHVHQHPELSCHEVQTTTFVQEKLQEIGVQPQVSSVTSGVIAVLGDTGAETPAVGLRADMDGLPIQEETKLPFASVNPGVMHACGHDGHTAMLLGATALLARQSLPGKVKVIFQPAEELGTGAQKLVEEGAVDDLQAIFSCHIDTHFPTGQITVDDGLICSYADHFSITVQGRGGHAARPHETSDTIVAAASLVMTLQTLVSREVNPNHSAVVTVGSFQAGTVHNVIAGYARLEGTIRSTHPETRRKTIEGLNRIVRSIGSMYGVTASLNLHHELPAVINSPAATAVARTVAELQFGARQVISQGYPSMGGEDFSFYQQKIEGCMVRLGAARGGEVGLAHSTTFDFDEDVLPLGAAWLAGVAWTWLHPHSH